ncbi:kinase-like domain-containing protein [Rhizophagus irregularis DAOM 181602=DAOM 197198]|nr:kinase-like domain-containing protein [Rhizophagus irregularis DAOM 181602=DAOM 197198]
MDEKPKKLWKYDDNYQYHVTIPTIDTTIESENVDERVVYIGDLEKRKQAYGICGECKEPGTGENWCQSYFLNEIKSHLQLYLNDIIQCFGITQDPNNKEGLLDIHNAEKVHKDFHSDTSYTTQSTSANLISECLDVQLSELDLNEICQDEEDNIE